MTVNETFMGKLIFGFLILFFSEVSLASDFSGKVTAVIDGNTLEVVDSNENKITLILFGIDCPELNQEFGEESRKCLEKIILGKKVTITLKGKDRLGNALAELLINGKADPRIKLLSDGLAWTAEKYPMADLEDLRISAQQEGKGLWKQDSPTPPWTYRRQQSMMEAKSS